MSMSARKRRHQRIALRLGRKRFRQAEKALLRGDHPHRSHFSNRYGKMGALKPDDLP